MRGRRWCAGMGGLVPNEAYSVRIEATGPGGTSVYDPSERFVPRIEQPPIRSYSRAEGVLSYKLDRPSRVHVQAGQAQPDPRTGQMDGPILKTVVDREPRIAGAVVEVWKGVVFAPTRFSSPTLSTVCSSTWSGRGPAQYAIIRQSTKRSSGDTPMRGSLHSGRMGRR